MWFQVHFGVELPFWLALPDGRYTVLQGDGAHDLVLSNNIARIDVGDFYGGVGVQGSRWVPRDAAEQVREEEKKKNPVMPITRHEVKTILTHVRVVQAGDETELEKLYESGKKQWHDETFRIVNRFLSAYMLVVAEDGDAGQVGTVAPWDVGKVLVSFWNVDDGGNARDQCGGFLEYVKAELPAPEPDEAMEKRLRTFLTAGDEGSIVDLLHSGARAQIERGNYRNAVVDDVTAFEMEVSLTFRSLIEPALPDLVVDDLLKQRFDSLTRWIRELGGPDLTAAPLWADVREARRKRQEIAHRGASANRQASELVHKSIGETIRWLRSNRKQD